LLCNTIIQCIDLLLESFSLQRLKCSQLEGIVFDTSQGMTDLREASDQKVQRSWRT